MASTQYMTMIPPGFQFVPTDCELLKYYLSKKVKGEPLPSDEHIHDCEIYGDKDKEPWKIFGENTSETFYVFTKLKKKGKGRRIDRIAGSGTWKGQRTDPVMDSEKNHAGDRKLFVFEVKGSSGNGGKGHWIMHELSLINCDGLDDWVLCRIYEKKNTKRPLDSTLPSLHCIEDETAGPWRSKRFRGDSSDGGCLEIATLISQLPPTTPLQQQQQQQQQQLQQQQQQQQQLQQQQQAMLGTMGDGIFYPSYQVPGLNWYS